LKPFKRLRRVKNVFFFCWENSFLANRATNPTRQTRISGKQNTNRVANQPANPVFWVFNLTRLDLRYHHVHVRSKPFRLISDSGHSRARKGVTRSWNRTILRSRSRFCLPCLNVRCLWRTSNTPLMWGVGFTYIRGYFWSDCYSIWVWKIIVERTALFAV